uniref:Uncharacterized protein n=1 Tax=Pseudomonas phage Orisa02 TaxID=3138543 RepID=A0AAU6W3A3_9VIRU
MTTNTLTTPLSLGQVAQYLAVAALIWPAIPRPGRPIPGSRRPDLVRILGP